MLREGRKEKVYCPSRVRKLFKEDFTIRFVKGKEYTYEELTGAVEECKAYFMVMTWLHQVVALRSSE